MPDSSPNVLIVEGQDDKYIVDKLIAKHEHAARFDIRPKGGFPALRSSIRPEINASGRRTVGIIADANESPTDRWTSIRDALSEVDCTDIPEAPVPAGAILSGPRDIRVGVWLMPDNTRPGEVEDFIADMIPRTARSGRSPNSTSTTSLPVYRSSPRTNARALMYTPASQHAMPRAQWGLPSRSGDLDHNAPAAQSLVNWLRELFSPLVDDVTRSQAGSVVE